MVGRNTDHSKWRCKTWKFLNDNSETKCTRCKDEKQVYKDKAVFGGASSKKRIQEKALGVKPSRIAKPTKPKIEEEKKQGIFTIFTAI